MFPLLAPPAPRPTPTPCPRHAPLRTPQRPKTVMTQQVIQQPVTTYTQQTYVDTQAVTRPVVTSTVRPPSNPQGACACPLPPAAGARAVAGRRVRRHACHGARAQPHMHPPQASSAQAFIPASPVPASLVHTRRLPLATHPPPPTQPVVVNKPSLAITATFGKGKGIYPQMVDNPQVRAPRAPPPTSPTRQPAPHLCQPASAPGAARRAQRPTGAPGHVAAVAYATHRGKAPRASPLLSSPHPCAFG